MVATVQIGEKNGTGGTFTQKDCGTLRFKNAENATVDANNPMVIPTAGSDWSYDKWTRFKVTVAPDTNISNLKFYTAGGAWQTGVLLWARATTTYATPTEPTGSTGYTNAFTYTSGAALALGTGTFTGTGEKGDHARLAMEVQSTASQGTTSNETLTYSYDEI